MQETCHVFLSDNNIRPKKILISFIIIVLAACIMFQIAFGIIWMIRNLNCVLAFGDTIEYLALSQTLKPDEYRPILYPLILRGLTELESLTSIPINHSLYIIQTSVSLASLLFFFTILFKVFELKRILHLKPCVRRILITIFSFYVLTTPPIVEFNFSILTDSLATSFLLMMLTLIISCAYLRHDRWYHFALIFLCSLVQALLRPERFYFCIVTLIFLAFWILRVKKRNGEFNKSKKMWYSISSFIAILLLLAVSVPTINAYTQTPGIQGRPKTSLTARLTERIVWGHFAECYNDFSEEVKSIFTYEQAQEIDQDNNKFGLMLTPMIQSRAEDRVDSIYLQMATAVLQKIPDKVVLSILEDCITFFVVPWHLVAGLNDLSQSATIWNYTRMAEAHPLYTSYYFRFAIYTQFFLFGLVFLHNLHLRDGLLRKSMPFTVPLVIASIFITLGFGVGAGAPPNYRYVLLTYVMWITWFLVAFISSVLRLNHQSLYSFVVPPFNEGDEASSIKVKCQ